MEDITRTSNINNNKSYKNTVVCSCRNLHTFFFSWHTCAEDVKLITNISLV